MAVHEGKRWTWKAKRTQEIRAVQITYISLMWPKRTAAMHNSTGTAETKCANAMATQTYVRTSFVCMHVKGVTDCCLYAVIIRLYKITGRDENNVADGEEGGEGVNRKRRYWQLLQLYGVGIFINTRTMRTRDKGKDYYRTRSHTPTRGLAVATVEDLRVPVMHSIIIHTCTQLVRVVLRRYCPVIDSPRAPVNTWRRSVYTYRIILTTKWHYQQTRIKYCNVIRIIQTRVCTF